MCLLHTEKPDKHTANPLPCVTHGKELTAYKHRQRALLPCVFSGTRQTVRRVFKWHSAKNFRINKKKPPRPPPPPPREGRSRAVAAALVERRCRHLRRDPPLVVAMEGGEDAATGSARAAEIRRSPWPWREGWRPPPDPPAPPPAEDGFALARTDPPAPPPPSTTCRRSSSRWPSSPGEEGRGRRSQVVLPAAGHVLATARGREATAHRRPHRPPALLLAQRPLLLLARPPPFLLALTAAAAPHLG